MNSKALDRLKDVIQDSNVNFLLGSGLSSPFISTLGNVELLLTELAERVFLGDEADIIRASIYQHYFETVIGKNLEILSNEPDSKPTLESYEGFLAIVNSILLRRKSTILSKQVNLFTTNLDIFLEKALEELALEYNDHSNKALAFVSLGPSFVAQATDDSSSTHGSNALWQSEYIFA